MAKEYKPSSHKREGDAEGEGIEIGVDVRLDLLGIRNLDLAEVIVILLQYRRGDNFGFHRLPQPFHHAHNVHHQSRGSLSLEAGYWAQRIFSRVRKHPLLVDLLSILGESRRSNEVFFDDRERLALKRMKPMMVRMRDTTELNRLQSSSRRR